MASVDVTALATLTGAAVSVKIAAGAVNGDKPSLADIRAASADATDPFEAAGIASLAPGDYVWLGALAYDASGVESPPTYVQAFGEDLVPVPPPALSYTIDASGVVDVAATLSGTAMSVKIAAGAVNGGPPSAADVRAVTADTAAPYEAADLVTLAAGQSVVVGALSYDDDGHESALALLTITRPTAGSGLDLTGRSSGDVLYVDASSGTPVAAWLSRPTDHATTTYVLGLYDGVPAWRALTDATVEPPPTESGPWTGTLTIAAGTVSSTLSNFVVAVDLATLPAGFWAAVTNGGGDIRVTQSDGTTLVPIDVVQINKGAGTGLLFFKAPSIASGADTTFKILAGDPANTSLAATDPNGRNAVWSGYHRVFAGGPEDRTGQGTDIAISGTPTGSWGITSMSPDLSTMHQGIAWDGTYYYTTDTDELVKWDSTWTEVARNSTPLADTGIAGVDHCGDFEVVDGELYIPVETYPSGPYVNQHIAVFSTTDLSFLRSYDISAQGREVSSLAYNPADGLLYASDYTNGASLPRYQLDGTFVGALALSATISQIQGITFFGGKLYLNSSDGLKIWEATLEGTVGATPIYTRAGGGGDWEGIGHTDRGLLVLYDSTIDTVYTLEPGWLDFVGGQSAKASGLTKFTQWTLGATVVPTVKTATRSILSYTSDITANTDRATLAQRLSPTAFGIWNDTDSWLMDAAAEDPTLGAHYRLVHTQDGTTSRKLYKNGALAATDSGVVQRPAGTGDTLYIGAEDASLSERYVGSLNFIYLRSGVLSDAWLAAEDKSWRTPATFYTITSD